MPKLILSSSAEHYEMMHRAIRQAHLVIEMESVCSGFRNIATMSLFKRERAYHPRYAG